VECAVGLLRRLQMNDILNVGCVLQGSLSPSLPISLKSPLFVTNRHSLLVCLFALFQSPSVFNPVSLSLFFLKSLFTIICLSYAIFNAKILFLPFVCIAIICRIFLVLHSVAFVSRQFLLMFSSFSNKTFLMPLFLLILLKL
jgi:hypothetical protein